jgi:aminopeptidase I
MVQHTPEFLRQRSSNLCLRMAALTAATSLQPAPDNTEAPAFDDMDETVRSWIIGGFEDARPVPLCHACWGQLRRQAIISKQNNLSSPEECALCQIRETNPKGYTQPFVEFLQESPTVFHTVDHFKRQARALGFTELPARDNWSESIKPGGKYYVSRNDSSMIAFSVGKAYKPGNGVAIVAGHIDALTARLRPVSAKPNKAGYVQLGVAPYAGGLNETWWDRDLSIGGRVIVRDESGKTSSRLVKIGWPSEFSPRHAPKTLS